MLLCWFTLIITTPYRISAPLQNNPSISHITTSLLVSVSTIQSQLYDVFLWLQRSFDKSEKPPLMMSQWCHDSYPIFFINGKKYDRNLSYKPKLGIHCTVSEMLFNSNSYCMSKSSAMWSQSSWFMCSQCLVQLSATTWVLSQSDPVGPCGQLTIVDKDLFESSEAGFFYKQQCLQGRSVLPWKFVLHCVPKPLKKREVPAFMDLQMSQKTWTITLWLVHFAERLEVS